jgi:signal recognition particle GTPase
MLNNLKERLKDGGLLVVCRTDGATNHGTVFRLSSSQLVPVERIGAGSEVEPLV